MQFTDDPGDARYRIERFEPGTIQISGKTYTESLIIMPDELIHPCPFQQFSTLTATHCETLLAYQPEIVLFSTGHQMILPQDVGVFEPLMKHHVGYEVMDTHAACRTYTILMAEGRKVLAVLFLE